MQNNNKIIMNLLPSIQKPRKGFKFSNPLSGIIYNNNYFLQQCQYEPDPEAQLSHKKRNSLNGTSIRKQSGTHTQTHAATQSRTRTKYWTKLSDSKINYSMLHSNKSMLQNNAAKNQQHSKISKGYKFPDIEIKIIDEIQSYKDFRQKNLRINLTHYYNMFFKKELAGTITADFIEIIQKYLQILISKMTMDVPVQIKDYPSQYFSIKSKRTLVQKIQQLQSKKSFRPIEQMIKYYCIPSRQFRQSCFRDILHMISISLFQKFNLSKQKDYVLLDQNGRIIEDLCAIKFSVTQLLITCRPHYERSFNQFRNIIQSNLQNFKKISFSDELKKNFRNSIAAGKFDQLPFNDNLYAEQPQRKRNTDSKLQQSKSPRKQSPQKPSSPEKYNPSKTTNSFNINTSKSKEKLNKHRVSKSSLANPTIGNASKLGETSIKMRSLSAKKRMQSYRQTFQKLRIMNNMHDITFNHKNHDRLLISVLKKQSEHLKQKSQLQIQKILKAFRIGPESQSISYEEYQRMCQVINCKGQNNNIVDFVTKYLEFNQYGELDKNGLGAVVALALNDINGEQVVLEIIWSWFQKNGLIDNNVLVKNTLESWYQKNKMAFVIVVSLVFGNNQASWIDMAYEVLV